jgi:hypothetical protein
MIAVFFGYEKYLCVPYTRRQPDIYLYSSESMDEINEFEQIIKDMRDEK